MKKIFVVLVLFCAFFKLFADDDKLRLAVMEFEDRSGEIPKKTLSDATEYLRGALISANKYIVIAQERQSQAMVKDMKKESYKECNDKNCQIQLGQALSADTILRTTITRLGKTFVIASELIDLEKEATVVGAREKYDGSENSMSEALDNIAEKVIAAYESIQNEESSNSGTASQKSEKPIPVSVEEYTNPEEKQSTSNKLSLIDEQTCVEAREKSTIEDWVNYLNSYPEGICAKEAKTNLENSKKSKPSNWSYRSPDKMNWKSAKRYCKNLEEDGYNDWRLPEIDELKTLALDCPLIEPKGKCPMSKSLRAPTSWSAKKCFCDPGAHNKLGDSDPLWSSTGVAFTFFRVKLVLYSSKGVGMAEGSQKFNVRCIRDEKDVEVKSKTEKETGESTKKTGKK